MEYIIKAGDSLSAIAQKNNTTVAEIQRLNPTITDPNNIHIGQKIALPTTSVTTQTTTHNIGMGANNTPKISEVQRDSLMACFSNDNVVGAAACPLGELAIYPVRYAIDEAPAKANQTGPNPLPKDWDTGLPTIKTRNYTLRQLRNGWLYVWDGKKFDEYKVMEKGLLHVVRENEKIPQVQMPELRDVIFLPGDKGFKRYIEYPNVNKIQIAYSQERWSEYFYKKIFDKSALRNEYMRTFDIKGHKNGKIQPHSQLIENIADYVADIDKGNVNSNPRFITTTVPTQSKVENAEIKPAIADSAIIGAVPNKDTAVFLALDDHIGILRDLNMQLTGRNTELQAFDDEHQHKLVVSDVISKLCNTGLKDEDFPASIRNDEKARLAFIRELDQCMKDVDTQEISLNSSPYGMTQSTNMSRRQATELAWKGELSSLLKGVEETPQHTLRFRQKYPDKDYNWFYKRHERWRETDKARCSVKYDEALNYLSKMDLRPRYVKHIDAAFKDIAAYVDFVGNRPEALLLDHTDTVQSALLTTIFSSIHEQISSTGLEQAQKWLENDINAKKTLITLIPYNFDKPLAQAIDKMAKHYIDNGELEPNEEPFDYSEILADVLGGANVANNTNSTIDAYKHQQAEKAQLEKELRTLINHKRLTSSKTFLALPEESRNAYLNFADALKSSDNAWQGWQKSTLYRTQTYTRTMRYTYQSLSVSVMHLAIYGQVQVEANFIIFDPEYPGKFKTWQTDMAKIERAIARNQKLVNLPISMGRKAYEQMVRREQKRIRGRGNPRSYTPNRRARARIALEKSYNGGPGLLEQLAELKKAQPAKFKMIYVPLTLRYKIMDLHIIQAVFKRIDVITTTTYTRTQPIGTVYSRTVPQQRLAAPKPTVADVKANIGVIGATLVILNGINCYNSLTSSTGSALQDAGNIIVSHTALANLLYSFKTTPLWQSVSKVTTQIEKSTGQWEIKKLIELSKNAYGESWKQAGPAFEQTASKFLQLAKTMAVLGVITNAVDAAQILFSQTSKANTQEERAALYVKGISAAFMGGFFAFQLVATTVRHAWLSLAFGPWVAGAIAVLSLIYLGASFYAEFFRYTGFDLWCKRCIWTRDKAPYWQNNEQGKIDAMRALQEILMAPQLFLIPCRGRGYTSPDGSIRERDYYLNIYLLTPPIPQDSQMSLKFQFVNSGFLTGPTAALKGQEQIIQAQLEENGLWVTPSMLEEDIALLESNKFYNLTVQQYENHLTARENATNSHLADSSLDINELIWASHIELEKVNSSLRLQLEVTYPEEILPQRRDGRGYLFDIKKVVDQKEQMISPEENNMENSANPDTYTIPDSDRMLVEKLDNAVLIYPPINGEDESSNDII